MTVVERAFELARNGPVRSFDELRSVLKAERYEMVQAHISGSLAKQLRAEIKARLAAKVSE